MLLFGAGVRGWGKYFLGLWFPLFGSLSAINKGKDRCFTKIVGFFSPNALWNRKLLGNVK